MTFDLSERWGDDAYERELRGVVVSELGAAAERGERVVGQRFGRVTVRVGSQEEGWEFEEGVMERWRRGEEREIEGGRTGREWRVEVVGEEKKEKAFKSGKHSV